jgi:predicted secreted protein
LVSLRCNPVRAHQLEGMAMNMAWMRGCFIGWALVWGAAAHAQQPAELPVAQLAAEVSQEVTPDELVISLQAQHAGKELPAVNQQAAAAGDALQQLLRRFPELVVRSQRMQTSMDYEQGKPQGWRVRNSLTLTTTQPGAFERFWRAGGAQLELVSMGYQPSEALRNRTRQQLIAMAGVAFREKSLELAKSLGYQRFEIKDVTLQEPGGDGPMPVMSTMSARGAVAAAPVVQEGQARLSLRLAGKIALLKN